MDTTTFGALIGYVKGFTSKAIASAELGVASVEVEGTTITITFEDDTTAEMTFPTPADGEDGEDGVSIVDVDIDANKHLICTLSDGNTVDAGALPMPSLTNYYTKSETDSKFNPRNNFKTINGNSIIGTGDIPVSGGGGGELGTAEKFLIDTLFSKTLFAEDMSDSVAQLHELWYGTRDVKEVSYLTVVCGVGTASVGVTASSLPLTVTAHYADETTATITNYTVAGTVKLGENKFLVTYSGKGALFVVTGITSLYDFYDYIQNNTANISTYIEADDFTYDYHYSIDFDFGIPNSGASYQPLLGTRGTTGSSGAKTLSFSISPAKNPKQMGYTFNGDDSVTVLPINGNYAKNTVHFAPDTVGTTQVLTLNDVDYTISSKAIGSTLASGFSFFKIANVNNGSTVSTKIGTVTIKNGNNEVVANFVPARRKSDLAYGMYDSVSDTFYEGESDTEDAFVGGSWT